MENNRGVSGLELLGVALTVTFVVLKLLGEITWSWWIVFSPIWGLVALACVIIAISFIVSMIANR